MPPIRAVGTKIAEGIGSSARGGRLVNRLGRSHAAGIAAALGVGAAVWSAHPIRGANDALLDFALGDPKADEYAVGAPVNLATWMGMLPTMKPRYFDKMAMVTGGEGLFDIKHYNADIIGDTFRTHKDWNRSAVQYANKHDQTYNTRFNPMYGPTVFNYQPPVRYGQGAGPNGDVVFGMYNLR